MSQERLDQLNAEEIARIDSKSLEHYDVLNAILANDCPRSMTDDGFVRTFEFELHCMTVRITAKLISTVDTIQYKILDFEIV